MIDPKMINSYPVKKYSDKQIEKCKQKIEFIKTRLIDTEEDTEYQSMINDILKDYESKLWEMENAVEWVSHCEVIY